MTTHLIKVQTEHAPEPKGPYSQGIIGGGFLFVSGQLPIDPLTGNLVGRDARTQTNQVINNIEAILDRRRVGLDKVVFATVTVSDLQYLREVNEAYAERFHDPQPARHTSGGTLPNDMMVEISCFAYIGK